MSLTWERMEYVILACRVNHLPLKFKLCGIPETPYLQVVSTHPCAETGEVKEWHGRKWKLSRWMTESEVVQTALKAALTYMEHEVREGFRFAEVAVFDPHLNLMHVAHCIKTGAIQKEVRDDPQI